MSASDLPAEPAVATRGAGAFELHLENFHGPFDLLLSLIAKHKLDVTEIALATVTDEFLAHIRALEQWDLDQASDFLVVAATLLDLKAARLLPRTEADDPEDLALLEARDLLFARLLQYRAYKQVADVVAHRFETVGRQHPRQAGLDEHLRGLLPELVFALTPEQLAQLAADALSAKKPAPPQVGLSHLHAPAVSVAEQAELIADRLRQHGVIAFHDLVADAGAVVVVVGRFLALLELFRAAAIAFDQAEPLGDLIVRWTGSADIDLTVSSEFDEVPDDAQTQGAPA